MKVLAVYNIKGGVGKTAAAVNLAYLSAREGARTLVWDLDPQAAATFYFRVRARVRGGSRKLVRRKNGLARHLRGTDFEGLDLLPADFSHRNLDLELDATGKPLKRIARLLEPLGGEYDRVVLDCAPGISLVSESVFRAADALLVPTPPTTLSLRTLEQLHEHLARTSGHRPVVLPFLSMVDRRKAMHRDGVEAIRRARPEFLRAAIPHSGIVERMGVQRAPVPVFAPRSGASRAWQELWSEVVERLADGSTAPR